MFRAGEGQWKRILTSPDDCLTVPMTTQEATFCKGSNDFRPEQTPSLFDERKSGETHATTI